MTFVTALSSENEPVSTAITQFTTPITSAVKTSENDLEDALWKSWRDLILLSKETPHDKQERLASFVQGLRKEDIPEAKKESVKIWDSEFDLDKLPILGPAVREAFNDTPESSSSRAEQEKWRNFNSFLAHLTSDATPQDPLDFSLFAIWSLRSAFEDQEELPSSGILGAAAVWIMYAGETLKKRVGETFDGKIAREGELLRGEKEWRGLEKERWEFWGEKIKLASGKCEDEVVRGLLKSASEKL